MLLGAHTLAVFVRVSFQRQIAYRTANLAGLFTNVFFLLFRGFALSAPFDHRADIGGLSRTDTLTYATVSQALLMVIPQWGRVQVAEDVRRGQIAMDLCRPLSYPAMFFARRVGVSMAYLFVLRFPWVMLTGALIGFLSPPYAPLGVLLLSIFLGALITNGVLFLIEVSAFWMENERGVRYIAMGLGAVLSGLLMPLDFYPEWVQQISHWLPFEHGLYTPVRLWLGHVEQVETALAWQGAWATVMIGLCFGVFHLGTRKLTIHGG